MSEPTTPDPFGQPPAPPPAYPYPPSPYAAPAYAAPTPLYAHWGLRLAGYLLDAVVLFPFYFVAGIGQAFAADTTTGDVRAPGIIVMAVAYLAAFAFTIWNQVIRQGRTGQSLGKKWVGVWLLREDNGQPLGVWLNLGRALLHILDALPCYLGFLWPLWDDKRQTFADKIVSSVVINPKAVPYGYRPLPPPPTA